MDYKKLFGNATKFVNEYNITTSASRPNGTTCTHTHTHTQVALEGRT